MNVQQVKMNPSCEALSSSASDTSLQETADDAEMRIDVSSSEYHQYQVRASPSCCQNVNGDDDASLPPIDAFAVSTTSTKDTSSWKSMNSSITLTSDFDNFHSSFYYEDDLQEFATAATAAAEPPDGGESCIPSGLRSRSPCGSSSANSFCSSRSRSSSGKSNRRQTKSPAFKRVTRCMAKTPRDMKPIKPERRKCPPRIPSRGNLSAMAAAVASRSVGHGCDRFDRPARLDSLPNVPRRTVSRSTKPSSSSR